jgi:hypothetical protein
MSDTKHEFDVEIPIDVMAYLFEQALELAAEGALKKNKQGKLVFPFAVLSVDRSFGRHCPGNVKKNKSACGNAYCSVENIGFRTTVEEFTGGKRVVIRDQPCCEPCRRLK